jgi:O-acetyl-ADP-ribose deacetylase (regulator of RNase III)
VKPHALERVECVHTDITLERVDAIVNAANSRLAGGGGVDGSIHRAAGPGLLHECRRLHPDGCPTGEARLTSGHALVARYVIHAVGPVYVDGQHGEPELLASAHEHSLALAAEHSVQTISFPAISTGVYGYPKPLAAEVALRAIARALERHESIERVRMCLFDAPTTATFEATRSRLLEEFRRNSSTSRP